MLTQLIESVPRGRGFRGLPGATASLLFHAALLVGAVVATRRSAISEAVTPPSIVDLTYDDDPRRPPPLPELPVPGAFTVPDLTVVPTEIPTTDPRQVWDSLIYLRTRVDAAPEIGPEPPALDPRTALVEDAVDEKPEMLSAFSPEYPDLLRQAGIEGTVVMEVIIDTTGRAEPTSLHVVRSPSRALEQSAREAVLKTRYRPGRVRGQAVRVLVQVPITFSIQR